MTEIRHMKTVKNKEIWTQNGISCRLQNNENAAKTLLHSHDNSQFSVWTQHSSLVSKETFFQKIVVI